MNEFCPTTPNLCTPGSTAGDQANPVSNYSSEEPDVPVFIGRDYSDDPPPLGGIWYANSCVGRITSTVSQQDANDRAAAAAVECLPYVTPQANPNPNPGPGEPPIIFVPVETYLNDAQTCSITCADGSIFSYTLPAGTIRAFSLAAANAQAYSTACNRANSQRICIGALGSTSACLDALYDQTVTFQIGVPPAQVAIIAGALPPGLSLTFTGGVFATSFTISGTPSGTGSYSFTIRVNDLQGNYMDKTFTIIVATIANTTLADGTIGAAYSDTLLVSGPVQGSVQWTVASGSLPTGLTLNASSGVISGTPTVVGAYTFTIQMQDGF